MKISKYAALFVALLFAILTVPFVRGADDNITATVSLIAMPKDQAMAFLAKQDLHEKPADALKELMALVEKKSAQSVGNPSVTTKSGQRALSEAESVKLDAELVASPDGANVDVTLALSYFKNKINTSLTVKTGGVKYLGAFDSSADGKDGTCLAFIRVDVAK